MASNGPPNDFHNQQTRYANYGRVGEPLAGGPPPADPPTVESHPDQQAPPGPHDPFDRETEPSPWYRRPAGLIGWIIAVLILIGLIAYGIMELIEGGEGTSPAPSISSTPTTSTTTPPTSATSTTAEPTTTPPTSSAVEPPAQQPTQQPTHQPTQQQPTHRRHLPQIPSVITIPGMPNPVTLPPGLPGLPS